jgi:hypothetical protein
MKWKERIKTGDLVQFVSDLGFAAGARERYPHLFEIGLVIDTQGLEPIVSFPSKTQNCATNILKVVR